MGKSVCEAFPEARRIFERADEALKFSLSRLCFEGGEEELKLTENTQPAILTVSAAVHAVLAAAGHAPVCAAGHSLGEYSAHVVAGTIAFEDAVHAVRRRGKAMQEACPEGQGAMAAILGLSLEKVETLCAELAGGEVLAPANINSDEQIVVAGHRGAVERLSVAAREAGAKRAVPLPVSAPFHCALMEPARRVMEEVLGGIPFSDPSFPVFSNVTADVVRDAAEARRLLVAQVTSPVRWDAIMRALAARGVARVVELGPGKVLTGLMRRARREAECVSIEDAEGLRKWLAGP
jgi:[acyl-carrier-protein] S-malonyltransferase